MILQQPDAPERARVIGSLTGDSVAILLDAVKGGVTVLDLAQVEQVDHNGLRVLARLWRERCALLGCPRWLELWLLRVHRDT
jgi:ABC-type transporter Mla MlaB component